MQLTELETQLKGPDGAAVAKALRERLLATQARLDEQARAGVDRESFADLDAARQAVAAALAELAEPAWTPVAA